MIQFKIILSSEFSKGAAWLTSGTAVIQLLTILFSPILTRLYTSDEFGAFALYSSFLGLFGNKVLTIFDAEILIPYKFLLPLGLFFSSSYLIIIQWGLRQKIFKKITYTKIAQGIGMNLSQVGLGFLAFGTVGLIVGQIIGKSAGTLTLSKNILKNFKNELKSVSIKKMKWTA